MQIVGKWELIANQKGKERRSQGQTVGASLRKYILTCHAMEAAAKRSGLPTAELIKNTNKFLQVKNLIWYIPFESWSVKIKCNFLGYLNSKRNRVKYGYQRESSWLYYFPAKTSYSQILQTLSPCLYWFQCPFQMIPETTLVINFSVFLTVKK